MTQIPIFLTVSKKLLVRKWKRSLDPSIDFLSITKSINQLRHFSALAVGLRKSLSATLVASVLQWRVVNAPPTTLSESVSREARPADYARLSYFLCPQAPRHMLL